MCLGGRSVISVCQIGNNNRPASHSGELDEHLAGADSDATPKKLLQRVDDQCSSPGRRCAAPASCTIIAASTMTPSPNHCPSSPSSLLPRPSFFPPRAAQSPISAERQIKLLNDERKASRLGGRYDWRLSAGDKVAAY